MMTNYLLFMVRTLLVVISLGSNTQAKPPDSKILEDLVLLKPLATIVSEGKTLTKDQWKVLEQGMQSHNDTTVALAALCLHELATNEAHARLMKHAESNSRLGPLTAAIVKIAREQMALRLLSPPQQIRRWQELCKDPSPLVRIEAVKRLGRLDVAAARTVLKSLEEEKSEISPSANRMRRELLEATGEATVLPIPAFENSYSVFERLAGPLATPKWARMHQGSATPKPP